MAFKVGIAPSPPPPAGAGGGLITFTRNEMIFELSNHLGNVLVTVGDKKVQHGTNGTTWDYYLADIVTANDYSVWDGDAGKEVCW